MSGEALCRGRLAHRRWVGEQSQAQNARSRRACPPCRSAGRCLRSRAIPFCRRTRRRSVVQVRQRTRLDARLRKSSGKARPNLCQRSGCRRGHPSGSTLRLPSTRSTFRRCWTSWRALAPPLRIGRSGPRMHVIGAPFAAPAARGRGLPLLARSLSTPRDGGSRQSPMRPTSWPEVTSTAGVHRNVLGRYSSMLPTHEGHRSRGERPHSAGQRWSWHRARIGALCPLWAHDASRLRAKNIRSDRARCRRLDGAR
jgi:hypothetical protein